MNIDEITRIAREAGFVGFDGKNKTLAKFAALVAAQEREECAEVAERIKMFYTENAFDAHKARCAGEIKTSILKRSNT
jgi:hypothetical protein